MSISHGDFFRLLERALEGYEYEVKETGTEVIVGKGQLQISLQPETVHKIASLVLPSTVVDFVFSETVAENEIEAFFEQFELSFRRGGG